MIKLYSALSVSDGSSALERSLVRRVRTGIRVLLRLRLASGSGRCEHGGSKRTDRKVGTEGAGPGFAELASRLLAAGLCARCPGRAQLPAHAALTLASRPCLPVPPSLPLPLSCPSTVPD